MIYMFDVTCVLVELGLLCGMGVCNEGWIIKKCAHESGTGDRTRRAS